MDDLVNLELPRSVLLRLACRFAGQSGDSEDGDYSSLKSAVTNAAECIGEPLVADTMDNNVPPSPFSPGLQSHGSSVPLSPTLFDDHWHDSSRTLSSISNLNLDTQLSWQDEASKLSEQLDTLSQQLTSLKRQRGDDGDGVGPGAGGGN